MATVDILKAHGIDYNAADLITAASRTGVPLYIAAAFVEQESRGANVFGHDGGGAYSGGGTVTQAKYNDFLRMVRAGHVSNGVGPCQITYPGYFKPVTTEVAGLWKPLNNMIFGLAIIHGYLGGNYSTAHINAAGQRYNSGSATGAPSYGSALVSKAAKWHGLLGGGTPSTGGATTGYVAGQKVVKAMQKHWKTTQDGVISSQDVGRRGNFPADRWTTIQWLSAGSAKGSKLVKAMQKSFGLTQDGKLGPVTAKALQKWAGVAQDGVCGTKTIGAICSKLGVK